MKKTAKIILSLGIGLVAVGGISAGIYFLTKKKDTNNKNTGSVSGSGSGNGNSQNIAWQGKVKLLGTRKHLESVNNHTVGLSSPRPPKGTFDKGQSFILSGTGKYDGKYTIGGVWIDSAGNIGAIYCDDVISNNATIDTGGVFLYEQMPTEATITVLK